MNHFPHRAAVVFFLSVAASARIDAGIYTVTSAVDDGSAGTLRWAIGQANSDAGSTISLSDNLGTIALTSALQIITTGVTINGGTGNTVSGNGLHRVFFVNTANATDAVAINNLTIANGFAKGGNGGVSGGGGMGAGGAIFVSRGAVTVAGLTLSGNTAQGGNGGAGVALNSSVSAGGGGGLGGNGGDGGRFGAGGGGGYGGNGGAGSQNSSGGGGGIIGNGGNGSGNRGGGGGGTTDGGTPTGGIGGGKGAESGGSSPNPTNGSTGGGGGGGTFDFAFTVNSGGNGGTYGGGGGAAAGKDANSGRAGDGGEFGGGGGINGDGGGAGGGKGGFGGGGGGGSAFFGENGSSSASGSDGGFGGGGGGGILDDGISAGYGGRGGRYAVRSFAFVPGAPGGGGGAALGGAIFVRSDNGASLTFLNGSEMGSSVTAGLAGASPAGNSEAGLVPALNGQAVGGAIFLPTGNSVFQSGTFSGEVSGVSGAVLQKTTAGTMTLNGGGTGDLGLALEAGTLVLGNAGALGSRGTISLSGGTLQFSAANAVDYSARISAADNQQFNFDTNGQNVRLANSLISAGGSLNKTGNGTLILGGEIGYSGPTTIAAGTLRLETSNNASEIGAFNLTGAGAALDLNGTAPRPVSLNSVAGSAVYLGGGALSLGGDNANITLAGNITDAGGNSALTGGTLTKTGTGNLTLTGSNAFSGNTTITGGTLQLGNGGVSGSLSGPIVNNSQLAINRSDALTLGSAISGSGSLTKTGSGLLTLGGVNSYTGSTDIQGGLISVNGSLASSSVTVAGGTNFTSTGTGTISGNIVGAGSFGRAGSGVTVFTGSSSHTGGTTVGGGTLQIGNGGTAGSISGNILNNGILAFNRSDFTTVSGAISGTGTLRHDGAGTLDLTGTNSHGNTVINAGTLSVGSVRALGSGLITINGGGIRAGGSPRNLTNELALNGSFTLGRLTNFSGNAALGADITITSGNPDTSAPASSTFSGVISGGHGLTFATGANPIGTIILSGANTYTGGTTLSGGTLALSNASALGTGGLTVSGGTLDLAANSITVAGLSGSGGVITRSSSGAGTLTTNQSVSSTFGGILENGSGTLGLTKSGAGTLILTGANTYTGETRIDGGTLQIGNGGTTGSITGGGIVNNGSLAFRRSDAVSYSGIISGAGSLVQSAQGTLTLAGSNTYTGTTILAEGTLSLGNTDALGSGGSIIFSGGTLQSSPVNNTDYSARFSNANNQAYRLDTNGQTVTLASDFGSAGGSLTKLGLGTLILAGNNSYDGGTTISGGTLQFTNASSIGKLTFSGGSLDLGGRDLTISDLVGGSNATIVNGSAATAILTASQNSDTAFSGTLQNGAGTLSLRKTGQGALTLGSNNTFTGGTLLEGGTLALGSAGAIGADGSISFSGGTLQFSEANTTDYSARFSNVTGQAIRLDTNGQAVTLASNLSGAGSSITKFGTGTLTLTGNNTNTGGTSITQGTLQIGNGGTTGSLGSGNIANDAVLAYNRSGETTLANIVSGSGELEQRGAGKLILTGDNTYTGNTRVLHGSLQIGNGGTSGSTVSNIASDSTTTFHRSDDTTYAGSLSGLGTLEKLGASTLVLTGQNVNAGGVSLTAGTLQIGGGGSTGSITGNVVNGGVLAFNRSDTLTYAGSVSGIGALEQRGTGTVILTGESTHSGNTTVSSGTLQIGAGGTGGSITGNVTNNASLVFKSSLNQTFGGNITGSGSFTKSGSNTLTLSGVNPYAGATNIQAGTLGVASNTAMGSAGSTVNLGASGSTGTFKALASLELSQNFSAARQISGRIDTNGFDVSIASINVVGTLVKLGSGQLTLTGASTVSGTLSSASAIRIAPGATLRQINDANFGTVGFLSSSLIVDGELIFDRSTSRSYDGTLSGSGTVSQLRSTLTLNGNNELFTGQILLQGGTLAVGSDTALGSGGLTLAGGSIRASGAGRTIANALTITGDFGLGRFTDLTSDIALTTDRTITMNNPDGGGGDSFLRGTVSGTGNLTVSNGGNGGALGLSGTNTYTGDTIVTNGGTLAISSQANLGAAANTLVFQNGTLRTDGDIDLAERAIRLAGNFTLDTNGRDTTLSLANALGDGSFTKAGGGNVTLTGAAVYTGGTSVDGGALIFSDTANFGTGSIAVNNGATLRYGANNTADISSRLSVSSGIIDTNGNDVSFANSIGGTDYTLRKTGAGTLNFTGNTAAMRILKVDAGTVRLSNDGSALGIFTTVADGAALEVNRSDAVTIRGVTANSGATLRFMGTGTSTLFVSTFSNSIRDANVLVDAGRLVINAQSSSAASLFESDITNNSTVEVNYGGTSTFSKVISGTGGFVKSGLGNLTLAGENTFKGGTTVTSGTLTLGNSGTVLADSGTVTVNGGTLRLGAADETIGSLAGSGGTVDLSNGAGRRLTVSGASNSTFAGTLVGSGGSLTKSGTGTLTLTGANSYTGNTTVTEGKLVANNSSGSATGAGSVIVQTGASLGGIGTLAGNLQVQSGGMLAPGNSPGTLTVGSAILENGATLSIELGGSMTEMFDRLVATGDVSLGGLLDISYFNGYAAPEGVFFPIIQSGGTLSGSFGSLNAPDGRNWIVKYDYAVGTVSVAAIPEPSAMLLFASGILLLFSKRKRS